MLHGESGETLSSQLLQEEKREPGSHTSRQGSSTQEAPAVPVYA